MKYQYGRDIVRSVCSLTTFLCHSCPSGDNLGVVGLVVQPDVFEPGVLALRASLTALVDGLARRNNLACQFFETRTDKLFLERAMQRASLIPCPRFLETKRAPEDVQILKEKTRDCREGVRGFDLFLSKFCRTGVDRTTLHSHPPQSPCKYLSAMLQH